jgi:anti-anti-sigma factor
MGLFVSVAPAQLLDSEVRAVGDHALVMLVGEIDVSTVGQLRERFRELSQAGIRHVSLNLAEVSFLDSTGISLIISENKRVEALDGELILFSPQPMVRRVFEITGVDEYLNIRPAAAHADNAGPGAEEDDPHPLVS